MYFSFCLRIYENKHGGAGQASRPLGSSFELLALVSKEMHNVSGTPPSSMCVTAYNVNQITSGGQKWVLFRNLPQWLYKAFCVMNAMYKG